MRKVTLDYETFATIPLDSAGSWKYANHRNTDIMCAAFAIDDEPPEIWVPALDPAPRKLIYGLCNLEVHAHNASFEFNITNGVGREKYDLPPVPAGRWRCSMARAAHANMPHGLELLCHALGLGELGKDAEGRKAMLKLCKPLKKGERNWDPDLYRTLYAYCARDVTSERLCESKLPAFPDSEQRIWELDRKINQAGLPIDVDLCLGAVRIIADAQVDIEHRIARQTGGEIETGKQIGKILEYVNQRGVNIGDLRAETVTAALDGDLPDEARDVLLLRQMSSSAAVSKYAAALAMVGPDGRLREGFGYGGATPTLRWVGRGLQPQNMKSGTKFDEATLDCIKNGSYGLMQCIDKRSPIDLLGNCVRGIICAPPGKALVMTDAAQIESRLAHWLAGDTAMLDLMLKGFDPYIAMAAKVRRINPSEVDKATRQYFKPVVLGAGYGMGATKFAVKYGLTVAEAQTQIQMWRKNNSQIVDLWSKLDSAALMCIQRGSDVRVGKVVFQRSQDYMAILLPSGRRLFYYKPTIGKNAKGYPEIRYLRRQQVVRIWGGHFLENLCQAISRDLLCVSMLELDRRGMKIVGSIHDEIVAEVDAAAANDAVHEVEEVMRYVPEWAAGLPLDAEGRTNLRLRK